MAKASGAKKAAAGAPFIDRGEPLPRSYAENRIVALVRSPEEIYVYWDVETEVRVAGSAKVVRVHCLSDRRSYDLEPPAEAENWYLRVAPNRTWRLELFEKRGARLRRLAASEDVTTPVRWAGESGVYTPAEIMGAVLHPISRPALARASRAREARERRAAEGAAPPRRAAHAAAAPARAGGPQTQMPKRGPGASPGIPPTKLPIRPPAPMAVPWEKVFAAAYAGGK